jgi:dual-specificity kinase
LPKEIIVIDDSPEPEAAKARPVAREAPAVLPPPISVSSSSTIGRDTTTAGAARHVAKKRRREEPTHYDPVYHNTYVGSHTQTPHGRGSPLKSTISSDRTTSAVHTTAATSLDSLSSGTSNNHDYSVHTGQKRKRTTRQQIATEAKRREAEVNDALLSYQPPPYPHKKASDVPVKLVHDVSRPLPCNVYKSSS